MEPFREFLGVAAQCSGKLINFAAIGREVGAQVATVQNYFQVLEDTYLGFLLPHYHRSLRKSQLQAPKFYFFDNGVRRSLEGSLHSLPTEGTSQYGELFEAFVIQEIFRLNEYLAKDFRLSFLRTKSGAEVDLILSRGRQQIFVEIKSSMKVDFIEVRKLSQFNENQEGPDSRYYYLSRDPQEYFESGVSCMPWMRFLEVFREL